MRELKFRVWDNKNKKFLPESHFAILGSGKVIVTLSGYYEHFTNKTQDDYVVQQYTGLKDSKGKEVYEGDIIYHKNDKAYCQCIWDQERLTYRWVGKNMSLPIYTSDDNMKLKEKIVGNIFEKRNEI
jgi:hypothetical protein